MKYILLLSCLLLLSCTETSERIVNTFPKTYELQPELHKIDEIIKPVDIIILDDYMVIQNDLMPNEDCFFVYDLESLDFLYSFANMGHGPNEFIAPALVQNGKDNIVSVFDQASFKLMKYKLDREAAHIIGQDIISMNDKRPWQEIYYRNDSILLFSTLSNSIQSYDLENKTVVDTVAFTSNLAELMGDDYNHSFDGFHFSYINGEIIVGYHYLNKIVKGVVKDNGEMEVEENHAKFPGILNNSLYDNTFYYIYTSMTPDFIFAQYVGYLFREMQPFPLNMGARRFDMLLEVYDSHKNPICILDLKRNFLRCKMDEKRMKLYAWDMLDNFDDLMVYDYSILKN